MATNFSMSHLHATKQSSRLAPEGTGGCRGIAYLYLSVFHFVNNGLESGGIVEGEVGENFAVDLDAGLVDEAHKLGVREILKTGCSVDTLDPESAEIAFFVLAVAVCVGETLFPGVLGNGPHIAAATEVTAGEFEDFLTTCA